MSFFLIHEKSVLPPQRLLALLPPYLGNTVVGVDRLNCCNWASGFSEEHNIDFILDHALYMKTIHLGKTKNEKIDAFKTNKLIRGGNFSLALAYSKARRDSRDVLLHHTNIMRISAQFKAHVSCTTGQYNLPALESCLILQNSSYRQRCITFSAMKPCIRYNS